MGKKVIHYIKKIINETEKAMLLIIGILFLFGVVVGFLYGFGYFMATITFGFIFFFIKKIERQDMDLLEQKKLKEKKETYYQEIQEKIEMLEKKAKVIKNHIQETNDLDSKLKLVEIEEEIRELKEKIKN